MLLNFLFNMFTMILIILVGILSLYFSCVLMKKFYSLSVFNKIKDKELKKIEFASEAELYHPCYRFQYRRPNKCESTRI